MHANEKLPKKQQQTNKQTEKQKQQLTELWQWTGEEVEASVCSKRRNDQPIKYAHSSIIGQ